MLSECGVQILVDVRTNPVSRYAPFANIRTLPALLKRNGIDYVHLGDSLGGKPADPSCYDSKGKPDYGKIRGQAFFQDSMSELLSMAEESTVAVMCAEEDPTNCHRRLLLGPELERHGANVLHIRGDGSIQGPEQLSNKKAYQKQLQGTLPL